MPQKQARWHVVVLTYACETCGAPPGQPCVSWGGAVRLSEVHVSRSHAAAEQHWEAADTLDPDPNAEAERDG